MECKKVQDQLITEYLDKELGAAERSGIEQHLSGCAHCQEFFEAVQRSSLVPFKETGEMQPDGALWQKIQEKIEAERSRSGNWFGKLMDILVSRFPFPVPLMRTAFVTALILVVVVATQWPSGYVHPAYAYIEEQMTFMGELRAGNTDLLNGDLKDYDAIFEEIGA